MALVAPPHLLSPAHSPASHPRFLLSVQRRLCVPPPFSESGCQGPAGSLVQNQQAGPPGPGGVRLQPSSRDGFPQVCLPPDLPGVRIQPSCPVSSVALQRLPLGCRPLVSSPRPPPGRPPEPLRSGLPGMPVRSSGFCEMCGKTRGRQLSCGRRSDQVRKWRGSISAQESSVCAECVHCTAFEHKWILLSWMLKCVLVGVKHKCSVSVDSQSPSWMSRASPLLSQLRRPRETGRCLTTTSFLCQDLHWEAPDHIHQHVLMQAAARRPHAAGPAPRTVHGGSCRPGWPPHVPFLLSAPPS